MKYRISAIIVLILAISLLAGCKGTYFFSFKQEQDLSNGKGTWIVEYDDYEFNANGINLQSASISCPLRFSGDFTMTVIFHLNVNAQHPYYFGICLGDGTWYETTENDLHVEVISCGSTGEYYQILDHDQDGVEAWHYDEYELLPGLIRNGSNTWVLTKLGDHITIEVNNTEFADFLLGKYNSKWFGPNIFGFNESVRDLSYGITIESVRVDYNGSTSKMPVD